MGVRLKLEVYADETGKNSDRVGALIFVTGVSDSTKREISNIIKELKSNSKDFKLHATEDAKKSQRSCTALRAFIYSKKDSFNYLTYKSSNETNAYKELVNKLKSLYGSNCKISFYVEIGYSKKTEIFLKQNGTLESVPKGKKNHKQHLIGLCDYLLYFGGFSGLKTRKGPR